MTVHLIEIDLNTCNGCKKCYKACYVNVFVWDKATKRPVAKYPEECATCSWCELVCEENSIRVIPQNPPSMPEPYPRSFYPKSYVTQ